MSINRKRCPTFSPESIDLYWDFFQGVWLRNSRFIPGVRRSRGWQSKSHWLTRGSFPERLKLLTKFKTCDKHRENGVEGIKMSFPNYVPWLLKWTLHLWNIVCFAMIYLLLAHLVIKPVDSFFSELMRPSKSVPKSNYKLDQYLSN